MEKSCIDQIYLDSYEKKVDDLNFSQDFDEKFSSE